MTSTINNRCCPIALIAGVLAAAAACTAQQPASDPTRGRRPLKVSVEPEFIVVTHADRPLLRYRYEKGPKPYFKELRTPAGVQFLLDSPPDHVHHRGLMYAVAVGGVDFWAEFENSGKQSNRECDAKIVAAGDDEDVVIRQSVDWRSVEGKLMATERRSVRVHDGKTAAGATMLTWRTTLELPPGVPEAQLSGSHYFGLGLRFVRDMDKNGKFATSENDSGEVVRGAERLYSGRWCAYTAEADGKPITVAMFDAPENPRPATWFTMAEPFAYLSATLKLHKEPMTLKSDRPLEVCYGIAAWDGRIDAARIDETCQMWRRQLAAATAAQTQPQTPGK